MSCHPFFRCRREIIASHFDERWESSSCNEMCDHCSSKESTSAEIDIAEHLTTLSQILERAEEQQVRVTGEQHSSDWRKSLNDFISFLNFYFSPKVDRCLAEYWASFAAFTWFQEIDKITPGQVRINFGSFTTRRLSQRRFPLHALQHHQLPSPRWFYFYFLFLLFFYLNWIPFTII